MKKILIIRFSSIGDIIQCMSVTAGIKKKYPDAELHWATRKDMSAMLKTDPDIDAIWEFDRKLGMQGLIRFAWKLRALKFDVVYDAHLNIRSQVLKAILSPCVLRWLGAGPHVVVRKKNRLKRFLFFNLKIKGAIEFPFRGMLSFQEPLIKYNLYQETGDSKVYGFTTEVQDKVNGILKDHDLRPGEFITLIPSAAWELKRWPEEHWKKLILAMPDKHFVILAGPDDSFTYSIMEVAPNRVVNLAGRTNLMESFYMVSISTLVVSADTGFLHAADLFKKNAIALMGPTAYGHPTGDTVKVLEVDLPCRPCTKEGNSECKLAEIKKCLYDITPKQVVLHLETFIQQES